MNPCICKNLISLCFKNSSYLYKPPITCSVAILYFSSSSSCPKSGKDKVSLGDYLINQHHFSPDVALKASSIKTCLKNYQNSDSLLLFLKENGFTNTHLEKMVKKAPNILFANLVNTVEPKIKLFQDLGFSSTDIAHIISADPWILRRSVDNQLLPSIWVLKSILGSDAGVSKVLKRSGWFLKCDLEKTMMPNIEFLKSCGISSTQIIKYVFNFPRFFLHKPESMKDFVRRVDEIGFNRKSKMFLTAIRTMSSMSMENWELKLKVFRGLGFNEDDIVSVFRSLPQVFSISERKIEKVTEFVVSRGNLDISVIVNHPWLLICSVELRLEPRLRVFDILKSKNLLRRKTKLTTFCKMSKKKFLEKYVIPNSDELGESYLLVRAQTQ